MAKKKYSDLVLRKDGIYEKIIVVDGKRKYFRSKDPEKVYEKIELFFHPPRTFAVVANEWKDDHMKKVGAGTWSGYNSAFDRAIEAVGKKELEDVTAADVDAVLMRCKNIGLASSSVKKQKIVFNQIFNFAIMSGYTKFNPVQAVKLPKNLPKTTREAPEDDVVDRIRNGLDCYWGLFAFFLLHTGCRKGEALAITGADIDRKNKVIHITKAVAYDGGMPYVKPPKSDSGIRDVPLLDALAEVLPDLQPDELLFPQENGAHMSSKTYQRHWNHYCKDAGFVTYTPIQRINAKGKPYVYQKPTNTLTAHQLRHGLATICVEAGLDPKITQRLLGHSDIKITLGIYAHIRQKSEAVAANTLNAYFSKNTQQNTQ